MFTNEATLTHEEKPVGGAGGRVGGITSMIGMLHPHDNKPVLLWGMQGGGLVTYDLPEFKARGKFNPHYTGDVRAICEAGGGMFVTGGSDGHICLWQWTAFS